MRRMSLAVAMIVFVAAGSADLAAQARATTGIGEARRIIRRSEPPRGLSTTGINLSEEARLREERERQCRYDRRGYYDAYGRWYGYDRYYGYSSGYGVVVGGDRTYVGGDNRTYVGGNRFDRDGNYDPNGRYHRDGRLLQVVPPGTQTTATTGTIQSTMTSPNATYAARPAPARVETARTAASRVAVTSAPLHYGSRDTGCGYVDRGPHHR